MTIRGLYLAPGAHAAVPVAEHEIERYGPGSEGTLWLDLAQPTAEDCELLQRVFAFHPLTIDDLRNARVDIPKIDDYDSYLFIICVGVTALDGAPHAVEFDLYVGPNYVVSAHHPHLRFVEEVLELCLVNARPLARGPDGMAHWLIDKLVDAMMDPVDQIGLRLNQLTERIVDDPNIHPLRELLQERQRIATARRMLPRQMELINRIVRQEYPELISTDLTMYFRDIYDHLANINETLDNLRETADSALTMHLSVVNNRMNEIMKAFAVVTVIFLPLTLLASIYGMNLTLPGQGADATFTVILVLMLALAGGMAWYFRQKGWF